MRVCNKSAMLARQERRPIQCPRTGTPGGLLILFSWLAPSARIVPLELPARGLDRAQLELSGWRTFGVRGKTLG